MAEKVEAERVARNVCPRCQGELDEGWECNDCDFDGLEIAAEIYSWGEGAGTGGGT